MICNITGQVDFNLGSAFNIGKIALWNMSFTTPVNRTTHGVSSIRLFTSLVSDFSSSVDLGVFSIDKATANPSSAQIIGFSSTSAQFIRFDILGNHGGFTSSLGDVAFAGTAASVPEPATVVLLCIGLAGIAGGAARRKRDNKAVNKGLYVGT